MDSSVVSSTRMKGIHRLSPQQQKQQQQQQQGCSLSLAYVFSTGMIDQLLPQQQQQQQGCLLLLLYIAFTQGFASIYGMEVVVVVIIFVYLVSKRTVN